MSLSDIKGERTFEVLADILEPALALAQDSEVAELFQPVKSADVPKGMTAEAYQVQRSAKCLPLMLRKHKAELIAILSSIEGTPKEEYIEKLTMDKLVNDFANMFQDPVMKSFLS